MKKSRSYVPGVWAFRNQEFPISLTEKITIRLKFLRLLKALMIKLCQEFRGSAPFLNRTQEFAGKLTLHVR